VCSSDLVIPMTQGTPDQLVRAAGQVPGNRRQASRCFPTSEKGITEIGAPESRRHLTGSKLSPLVANINSAHNRFVVIVWPLAA
jgi:hypothetical protein